MYKMIKTKYRGWLIAGWFIAFSLCIVGTFLNSYVIYTVGAVMMIVVALASVWIRYKSRDVIIIPYTWEDDLHHDTQRDN
jgi:hypothetical protein